MIGDGQKTFVWQVTLGNVLQMMTIMFGGLGLAGQVMRTYATQEVRLAAIETRQAALDTLVAGARHDEITFESDIRSYVVSIDTAIGELRSEIRPKDANPTPRSR